MSETSMNINNEGTATTTERSDDVVLSVKHVASISACRRNRPRD